jgi:hypothetical protein
MSESKWYSPFFFYGILGIKVLGLQGSLAMQSREAPIQADKDLLWFKWTGEYSVSFILRVKLSFHIFVDNCTLQIKLTGCLDAEPESIPMQYKRALSA